MWVKNSFKVEVERHKSNLKNEKLILVQHENVKKIFFFFLVWLVLILFSLLKDAEMVILLSLFWYQF